VGIEAVAALDHAANQQAATGLVTLLRQLQGLLRADRQAASERLVSRLAAQQLRVLVVGEAKRGKSTFVNALLGRDVLPTGVLPVTALVTTLTRGPVEQVVVDFADGRRETHPLHCLAGLVTETKNPQNRLGVAAVTVIVDAPLLADGLQLVDTPGTGSIFEHNTEAAERGLDDVDGAIFVFTADPPISAAELRLLDAVRERAQFVLFVLNKIDYLAAGDAGQVHAFTAQALAEHVGGPVELWDCSAATALVARRAGDERAFDESGMGAFEHAFGQRLAAVRDTALRDSIAHHARRLLHAELDETALALRLVQLRAADEQHRVDEFTRSLGIAANRRANARNLVDAGRRSISATLTSAAEEFGRRLHEQAAATVREFVSEPGQATTRPGDLERAGHARVAAVIRASVEAWQHEQKAVVDNSLAALAETIEDDVLRALESVRTAAHEQLGVQLTLAHETPAVPATTRFSFDFSEDAGPTELLAGALRRRLPERIGRRRALAWLERDVADLVDRHVGRARSDLDERLRSACRDLAASAADELGSVVSSLRAVIEAASAAAAADVESSRECARLEKLASSLRELDARLSHIHPSTSPTPKPRSVP
jgi:Dynamin family